MIQIRKYPRTPHIEGSGLQPGATSMSAPAFWQTSSTPTVTGSTGLSSRMAWRRARACS